MRRSTSIVTPPSARKPVSFAIERVFPEASGANAVEPVPAPVIPRVRDSLVLRVVAKTKVGRTKSNEHRAR